MTVKEMFVELLKLVLKGKGKYRIYTFYSGRISGVMKPNEEDDKARRILVW